MILTKIIFRLPETLWLHFRSVWCSHLIPRLPISSWNLNLYFCICVFAYLCICMFAYLCICVFVYLISSLPTSSWNLNYTGLIWFGSETNSIFTFSLWGWSPFQKTFWWQSVCQSFRKLNFVFRKLALNLTYIAYLKGSPFKFCTQLISLVWDYIGRYKFSSGRSG